MKRTAMQHTKMKKLMRLLSIPQYAAVGILESLWHLTAREAPEGNIGKLSDEDIAVWIDWLEEPNALVTALITAGWIDRHEVYRLVVHDWMDHADDATKKALARQRQKCPDMSGQIPTAADKSRLPVPVPLPVPLPVPEPKPGPEEKALLPEMVAQAVMDRSRLAGMGLSVVLHKLARQHADAGGDLNALTDRMVKSWDSFQAAKPRLKWFPGAAKFFGEGMWENEASWPWKESTGPPQPGVFAAQMTDEQVEAARKHIEAKKAAMK